MKTNKIKGILRKSVTVLTAVGMTSAISISCSKWHEEEKDGFTQINQKNGRTLGYNKKSGIKIIYRNGYAFKDLNKNGELDIYEDWRKSPRERAEDLASVLSVNEIAGLMLYSSHQAIPGTGTFKGTYDGKPYEEGKTDPSALSDEQKEFLKEDNLRHILVTSVKTPAIAARWNNKVQAFCESLGHGIPVNNSSDPRNGAVANAEFNAGNGGRISMWPGDLGLAATGDPEITKRFGIIASREYRALGIATALSPQIDIATEPRWYRFSGTFGEDPDLTAKMAKAYVDGFQTTYEGECVEGKWGFESVNAMVKHWPGGGPCESGRDAHYGFGKYAVYPGNDFENHLKPFTDGAFRLDDGTGSASAVMPYYTISYGRDPNGNNVGNSYSKYIITDLLRNKYKFDGVVCTDWAVTADEKGVGIHSGKCWGEENLTVAERHFKALMAGVDQFGGNNDKVPVMEAYNMGVKQFGEKAMKARFEKSAVRLLKNMFRTGLFDNPYTDPVIAEKIVGCPEYMKEGYLAQVKSVIMLKNKSGIVPLKSKAVVYMEKRHYPAIPGFFGGSSAEHDGWAMEPELLSKYFTITDDPQKADFGIAFIRNPMSGYGYDIKDAQKGGSGYVPISLQYNDYTARYSRRKSIAGGDPYENFTNRSYRGKSVKTYNKSDMYAVTGMKKKLGDKPLITIISMDNPMVMGEIEKYSDVILVGLGIQNQAYLDILIGKYKVSGKLPFQLPADMKTVEGQNEDAPRDMRCYKDSEGNIYDFGFGLSD